jgi:hypothetical protein
MKRKRVEIHTSLEDLAESIAKRLLFEDDEDPEEMVKRPIGVISKSLQEKYETWRYEHEDFLAEVEFKKEQMEKQAQRELDSLFKARFQAMQDRKQFIWETIREELKLNEDTALNFDPTTGIISEWVRENGEE